MLWNFLREEEGQDLIEYTLLLAFVVVAAGAIFWTVRDSITTIWTNANTQLGTAAS